MKNKLRYLLVLIIAVLALPCNVLADPNSASQVNTYTGGSPSGKAPSKTGAAIWVNCSGVRFTFIDQYGNAIPGTGSYDFTTEISGCYGGNYVANVGTNNKSRLTGGVNRGLANPLHGMKKLADLQIKMDELTSTRFTNADYTRLNIYFADDPTYRQTRGSFKFGYGNEANWFRSLTLHGLPPQVFQDNINAFLYALQSLYPEFDAASMFIEMGKSCNSEKEIYIQMEPMFTAEYKEVARLYGTPSDHVNIMCDSNYSGGVWCDSALYFMNLGHVSYSIYYGNPGIKAQSPAFVAYNPVNQGEFLLSGANDVRNPAGIAVGIDWATDSASFCGKCAFNSGQQVMSYEDNVIAKNPVDLESNELRRAIDPKYTSYSNGVPGYNCCYTLENDYKNNNLSPEWKNAYNKYCNTGTQPPSEETPPTDSSCRFEDKDGSRTYYCTDGEVCDENKYESECGEAPDCCTEDEITAGKLEGIIVNCCVEDTHSYVKDYDLDELFCKHNGLKVDKYWEKCHAEEYINNDVELNEYCDMYCTERVTIDVPEAITAKSGRYFTLEKNSKGSTTSPYIEGYKRCRVRIKYNEWEAKYIDTVKRQIEEYKKYQEQMAYVESYNKLIASGIPNNKIYPTLSCSGSASTTYRTSCTDYDCISGCDSKADDSAKTACKSSCTTTCTRESSCSKPVSGGTCEITYTQYNINSNLLQGIYSADSTINAHNEVKVYSINPSRKADFNALDQYRGNNNFVATITSNGCETAKKDAESRLNGHETCYAEAAGKTLTINNFNCSYEYNLPEADLESIKGQYQSVADGFANTLRTWAQEAKTLENKLSTCNNYFTSEAGKPETMYDFNPQMTFKYSQIYRDDNGRSKLDEINIPFMNDPGCKITGPEAGIISYDHGTDTYGDRYSGEYGTGNMFATDFSGANLQYAGKGFNQMLDKTYPASKRFTHDARYKAVCEWQEEPNNVNTLVPNGAVTENAEANFTIHEREYKIYLTTYDGTFETDWSIKDLGEKGKFDKFIRENGTKTCAGNNVTTNETFSCQLHVEYEIVYTGKCNGVTKNPDDCDPVNDVNGLFTFKVVDETNIFPTGTTTPDGSEVAKNWTATDKGLQAKAEIEENGRKGITYDESKVTYKFHLTPAVMRHIKNYNATRNSNEYGGYSDFNMVCDCPDYPQTNTAESGVGCTKCKSVLLDDLEDGVIKYSGQTHNVNVWTANRSIDQVRTETWR